MPENDLSATLAAIEFALKLEEIFDELKELFDKEKDA